MEIAKFDENGWMSWGEIKKRGGEGIWEKNFDHFLGIDESDFMKNLFEAAVTCWSFLCEHFNRSCQISKTLLELLQFWRILDF